MKYDLRDFTLDSGELNYKAIVDALQGLYDKMDCYEIKIINLCMEMRRTINKQREMLECYDTVYGPITNKRVIKEISEGNERKENIKGWIEEVGLSSSDRSSILARDLYTDYLSYIGPNSCCDSITSFNKVLCDIGYDKVRSNKGIVFMVEKGLE